MPTTIRLAVPAAILLAVALAITMALLIAHGIHPGAVGKIHYYE